MMQTLRKGMSGESVKELQTLLNQKGFGPDPIDGKFGPATEAAVIAFQKSRGLDADGIAGKMTWSALQEEEKEEPAISIKGGGAAAKVTVAIASQMFPDVPVQRIEKNLPGVLESLVQEELSDKPMVLAALATIRAETAGFEPISEYKSKYNTSPDGHPFDKYDDRKDLGNQGKPDGELFRGRGYVQLTGRHNYQKFSEVLGLGNQLVENPDLANDPKVAGQILAAFLKSKESKIRQALQENDLKAARRLVNGGSHGLDRFSEAYNIGDRILVV